ncbi:glutathione S-transferase [Sphingomonas sp. PP-CE-3G-477]|uniref:glutathione S-transferase n=1 Tax=Sphingomonas sp. PP-CE-3G-477 TaxID=2135660 RepID=UPI000D39A440|nr:glutathione S-transferase [Sphingomonas sp. PP-CE-3G-477]PTQ64762.1 glutathione S-transferase [Sphingomonas sp. PP-CE-3G-477]
MIPVLYSFRRCPYAMRARLAIAANDRRVELREIVLRDKPAAMIDASPKGTVPVLVLPDGTIIDQSLDIMRWACANTRDAEWPTGSDAGLIATNDGEFKHHLDRYKYANRYDVDPIEHRGAATVLLRDLDERLRATGSLGSGPQSMTDLAIMPFVRQFAQTDRSYFDGLPFERLHAWLAMHLASALFAWVMIRPAPWQPGDPSTVFPTSTDA